MTNPSVPPYAPSLHGGAINVITRKPTQETQGDISVEAGRFDSINVEAALGGPIDLSDTTIVKLARVMMQGADGRISANQNRQGVSARSS